LAFNQHNQGNPPQKGKQSAKSGSVHVEDMYDSDDASTFDDISTLGTMEKYDASRAGGSHVCPESETTADPDVDAMVSENTNLRIPPMDKDIVKKAKRLHVWISFAHDAIHGKMNISDRAIHDDDLKDWGYQDDEIIY
jgi:hypothetical protein